MCKNIYRYILRYMHSLFIDRSTCYYTQMLSYINWQSIYTNKSMNQKTLLFLVWVLVFCIYIYTHQSCRYIVQSESYLICLVVIKKVVSCYYENISLNVPTKRALSISPHSYHWNIRYVYSFSHKKTLNFYPHSLNKHEFRISLST